MSFGSQSIRSEPMPGANTSPTVPSVPPIGPFLGSAGGALSRHSRNGEGLDVFERCQNLDVRKWQRGKICQSIRMTAIVRVGCLRAFWRDTCGAVRQQEPHCRSDLARLSRFCGLTYIRPCRGASISAIKRREIETTSGSTRASFPAVCIR